MQQRVVATGLAVEAGLALGLVVVLTEDRRHDPLWLVWAPITVALSVASFMVLVYGVLRWSDLNALTSVPIRSVALPVGAMALVGAAGVNVTWLAPETSPSWRSALLLTLPLFTGAPAAACMFGVRVAAIHALEAGTAGAQFELLIDLRHLLQRLLAALGSVVALTTFQSGALMALDHSHRPPQYVLVIGAYGTLLVAVLYVPGWTALHRQANALSALLFPLGSLARAKDVLNAAENRQKLAQLLGANSSLIADMQAGIVILTPLLASAAAAWLPG